MELDGALDEYRKHKQRVHPRCEECFGHGHYWTEWSDSADRDPAMVKLVIMRPIMPDGTVLIRCQHCNGSGVVVTDAYVNHEHHPA